MARTARRTPARRLHEAAWPDMFANLQSAYAELTRAQFELEQRAAEIEETRDLFQQVIESMSEALFLLDRTGRVIQVNPAACALLEYSEAELVGRPLTEIWGSDEIPATPWQLMQRAPTGVLTNLETEAHTRSGQAIPVSVSCGLVRDKRRKITGVLAVARDMRETRRLIASLQAALKTREQFLTIASHELKTPLAILQGYTGLLQRTLEAEMPDPERIRQALGNLEIATQRLTNLVTELLDVSQLESGRLALQRQPVDLVELTRGVLSHFRTTGCTRHTLRLDTAVPQLRGVWDRGRLEQVLTNLLENAVKYSPDGGEVVVEIGIERAPRQEAPPAAVVRVSDPGIGIPPDQRANLFELFYRASNASEHHYSGLGVGLHISREIARRHGGDLELERSDSSGSTFRLALPLGEETLEIG